MPVPAAQPPHRRYEIAGVLQARFFGPVRTLLKRDGCELPCAASETEDEFWTDLLQRFPEIETLRAGIRLARNGEFLAESERLQPGDEVALIPPVSGG